MASPTTNRGRAFSVEGPRTWAAAVLVGLSVADPGLFTTYGLAMAGFVWLTGNVCRLRTDVVFVLVILGATWSLISTTWAINPEAPKFALNTAIISAIFLLLRDAIRNGRQMRFVSLAFVFASFLAVIRVVVGGYNYSSATTTRHSLEGLNANYLGYALSAALAVIVILWGTSTSRATKMWLLCAVAGVLVGLRLTDTRGAVLGAVALAAWLFASMALRRPPLRMLVGLLVLTAIGIAMGIYDATLRSLDFGSRATGDLSRRLVLWPYARMLWEQSPLMGLGPKAVRGASPLGIDAHNVILEVGAAQGIVGVSLFCALMWATLGRDTRHLGPRMRALLVGSFLATSAPSYLTGSWESTPAAWMALLIVSRSGLLARSFTDRASEFGSRIRSASLSRTGQ